jgi:hypothetical protein
MFDVTKKFSSALVYLMDEYPQGANFVMLSSAVKPSEAVTEA